MRLVVRSALVALAIAALSVAAPLAAPGLADAASSSAGTKTVTGGGHYGWDTAACPSGYRVSGGGFVAPPGSLVSESRPDGTSAWTVRATLPGASPWVTAFAVCVR